MLQVDGVVNKAVGDGGERIGYVGFGHDGLAAEQVVVDSAHGVLFAVVGKLLGQSHFGVVHAVRGVYGHNGGSTLSGRQIAHTLVVEHGVEVGANCHGAPCYAAVLGDVAYAVSGAGIADAVARVRQRCLEALWHLGGEVEDFVEACAVGESIFSHGGQAFVDGQRRQVAAGAEGALAYGAHTVRQLQRADAGVEEGAFLNLGDAFAKNYPAHV